MKTGTSASTLLDDFGGAPLYENMKTNAKLFVMKALGAPFPRADNFEHHYYHHKKAVDSEN